MLKVYKRRLVFGLMALMITFIIIFLIAFIGLRNGNQMFNTGLGLKENWIVIGLCILSMIKVIHEIRRV